jgi:plastocyanin
MRKEFMLYAVVCSVICISMLSGCTQPPASSGNSVTIQNYAFSPGTLTIKVGGNVTWTNKDNVNHQPKSDTGLFESSPLAYGQSYTYQFTSPGTYNYSCAIHSTMHGKIIVQ